jgi:hypothetical protein
MTPSEGDCALLDSSIFSCRASPVASGTRISSVATSNPFGDQRKRSGRVLSVPNQKRPGVRGSILIPEGDQVSQPAFGQQVLEEPLNRLGVRSVFERSGGNRKIGRERICLPLGRVAERPPPIFDFNGSDRDTIGRDTQSVLMPFAIGAMAIST